MIERNEFSMIEHRVHGDTANTVKASTLLSVNRYCNMIERNSTVVHGVNRVASWRSRKPTLHRKEDVNFSLLSKGSKT